MGGAPPPPLGFAPQGVSGGHFFDPPQGGPLRRPPRIKALGGVRGAPSPLTYPMRAIRADRRIGPDRPGLVPDGQRSETVKSRSAMNRRTSLPSEHQRPGTPTGPTLSRRRTLLDPAKRIRPHDAEHGRPYAALIAVQWGSMQRSCPFVPTLGIPTMLPLEL